MVFRCALIGTESLLVRCGELLRERGHQIVAVVSDSTSVCGWAEGIGTTVLDPDTEWPAVVAPLDVDFLFSIANLRLLPASALEIAKRGAINFHDGPLPKYAGIGAPIWSVLAREKEHGVTWHRMEVLSDAGSILKQRLFPTPPDETAVSLNARCYEAGAETFAELLAEIELGSVTERRASLDVGTMHKAADRPAGRALIDWHQAAEKIEALARALDHGSYANPFAVPKFLAPKGVYVAVGIDLLSTSSGAVPGTVITIEDTGWTVATGTSDVRVARLAPLNGSAFLEPRAAAVEAGVSVGTILPAAPAALVADIDAASRPLIRHERWWADRLATLVAPSLSTGIAAGGGATTPSEHVASYSFGPAALRGMDCESEVDLMAAVFAAFVGRWTGDARFDLGYSDEGLHTRRGLATEFFAPVVPWRIVGDVSAPAVETVTAALADLALTRRHKTYARSVRIRYPAVRKQPLTELPIAVEVVDTHEQRARQPSASCTVTFCAAERQIVFRADGASWTERSLQQLGSGFVAFLAAYAANPDSPLAHLAVMDSATISRLLQSYNATSVDVSPGCIHSLIEAQVARTPDAVALHAIDGSLTYRELNRRANRLAGRLREAGAGPDELVGLCLPRTSDLVVAMLAIQKSGAAYVPIDPAYPPDRVRFMLADSGAKALITTPTFATLFPDYGGKVVLVEEARTSTTQDDDANVTSDVQPSNLAYAIYTSGSTGTPKGVLVEHRNVTNFFAGMDARLGTAPGVWLAVTSLSFDISVLELCWTLARGFTVVLADDAHSGAQSTVAPRSSRGIDFSLFYFSADENENSREKYRLLLEGARFADEHGFTAVWTPERHFHAFGGLYPNPAVTGAAIAAITRHVQIRAGSCVLPLHHPLRIAEEWSVVDNLSGGRVGVSFATGWQPNDFVLRPEGYGRAKDAFLNDIDTIQRLWRGDAIPFTTPSGQSVELRILPRPIQPSLPVWYTTAGNPESYKLAGQAGFNLLTHLLGQSLEELKGKIAMYREAWRAAGHGGSGVVSLMLHTFVGDDDASVKEIVRRPLTAYLRTSVGLVKQYADTFPALKKRADGTTSDLDLTALSSEEMEALLEYSFERYYETSGIFGTPARAGEMVERVKTADVDEIACLIDFGVNSERALAHLEHLNTLRVATSRVDPTELVEDRSLPALITRYKVTHFQCTPSMAAMLLASTEGRAAMPALRQVLIGGEAFPTALARQLSALVGGELHNMYGPTETTVWSATERVADVGDGSISIGTPIANTLVFVVDGAGQPVPPGTAGELLIGGSGVVRGYHARPELTAERFTWFEAPGVSRGRVYRTGDLVMWREDGRLEFLGRIDHQVKIRGHRIELGEIESCLGADADVREAVVIAREDVPGDVRLVAYVVARDGRGVDEHRLRERCRAVLPDWMVPSVLVPLPDLPRTPNRKVDRRALPAPHAATASLAAFVAPTSSLEQTISAVWAEVLRVEKVGMRDNFFDLGGHSLLAVQVHAKLRTILQKNLSITDLFRFPTVASLAAHLAGAGAGAGASAAVPGSARADARREALRRRTERAV